MESSLLDDASAFELLPNEVILSLFAFLNGIDICEVLSVCKRFRELANDEVVWKDLCLRITTRIRLQLTGGNWRKYWSIYLRDVAPINRLLVLSEKSNVFTCSPDGTEVVRITTDGSPHVYSQATWSSLSHRIALTAMKSSTGRDPCDFSIQVHKANGGLVSEIPTIRPCFYIYWHPDDTRLTFLSNWLPHTLACQYIDLAEDNPRVAELEVGRPIFYTYSPFDQRILCHMDNETLETINMMDGQKQSLLPPSEFAGQGTYPTPVWTIKNKLVVIMVDKNMSEQHLVVLDAPSYTESAPTARVKPKSTTQSIMGALARLIRRQEDTEEVQEDRSFFNLPKVSVLDSFPFQARDYKQFVGSADGNLVMYAKDRRICVVDITKPHGPNYVYVGSQSNPLCFCFSPNSKLALVLEQRDRSRCVSSTEEVLSDGKNKLTELSGKYHWEIIELATKKIITFTSFDSCEYFANNYLPFFAQYFQSMTFFSPDSHSFVYPADERIYVQKIASGVPPVAVAKGLFASWSYH